MEKEIYNLIKELKIEVNEEELRNLEDFIKDLNDCLKPLNSLTKKIAENKEAQDQLIISIYDYFNPSEN